MNIFKKTFVPYVCAALALLLIAAVVIGFGCSQKSSSNPPSTKPNYNNSNNNSPDDPWVDNNIGTSGDSNDTSDSPSQPDIEYAVWDGSIASGFAGGDGSESAPYEIADGAQLAYLARQVANENATYAGTGVHYILTDNIDLNNHEWCPIGTGVNLSGDSSDNAIFHGSFDGNDKHITNVLIQNAKSYHRYFGLFGNIEGATIQNLTIDNLNYSGFGEIYEVGGLVGRATESTIKSCMIQSGSISASSKNAAGGFTGELYKCTITNCSVTADLQCRQGGGFAAFIYNSWVSDCTANTNMNIHPTEVWRRDDDTNVSGGFIGYMYSSTIMYSKATGNIQGSHTDSIDHWAGGFAGCMDGSGSAISDCYSSGSVQLSGHLSTAAGFVVRMEEKNTVIRCISFGDARGNRGAGFCHDIPSTIDSCVAYGNVYGSEYAFPFTTDRLSADNHCYRPESQIISPRPDNTYGTAQYLEDMIQLEFFDFDPLFAAGWDFTGFNVTEKIYPVFRSAEERAANGITLPDNPFDYTE